MKLEAERVKCDICGSEDNSVINEKKPWTASPTIRDDEGDSFHKVDVICNQCGLIFKNPMITKDSLEVFYKDFYAKIFRVENVGAISKDALNNAVVASVMFLAYMERIGFSFLGKKVFEVGSGFGCLAKGIQSFGASEVFGCEPDPRASDIANKLFCNSIPCCSLNEYLADPQYSGKKYDVIVMQSSLEHFHSPKQTIEACKSILNEDGRIVVEVPSIHKIFCNTILDGFLSAAHNYTFSKDSLANLANLCGFEIENLDYAGHRSCMIAVLKRSSNPVSLIQMTDDEKHRIIKYMADHEHAVRSKEKVLTELISDINVYSSILSKIDTEFYAMSNFYRITGSNLLLERGHIYEALEFLKDFSPDQPIDEDICEGTRLYLMAMAARQMGDFVKAYDLLEQAMKAYPPYRKYNFTRDLTIDGVLSETVCSSKMWWNAERVFCSLG
jgi:SAM-dependent methyltransferase